MSVNCGAALPGSVMPRPRMRFEPPRVALKRRDLEVVPHKQMKNFMALKNKIINTDELIKRYRGKVAESESNRQDLREARSQLGTTEKSMKGLKAELQALHEENELLKSELHTKDSELESIYETRLEDEMMIKQMTTQLQETFKMKEEYDQLTKMHSQTSTECERWKKLYQNMKKKYDTLKSTKSKPGARTRHQSLRGRRPSEAVSLPPLISPQPFPPEPSYEDPAADATTITSPSSIFSLPLALTASSSNDRFLLPTSEVFDTQSVIEEGGFDHDSVACVSPLPTLESKDGSLFSPPIVTIGPSSLISLVGVRNGEGVEESEKKDEVRELLNCGKSEEKDLVKCSGKGKYSETETVVSNGSGKHSPLVASSLPSSTKVLTALESMKSDLFGEMDSDDNLSVSDSSSCCSMSSLSTVDDLADLLGRHKEDPLAEEFENNVSTLPNNSSLVEQPLPQSSLPPAFTLSLCSTATQQLTVTGRVHLSTDTCSTSVYDSKGTADSPAAEGDILIKAVDNAQSQVSTPPPSEEEEDNERSIELQSSCAAVMNESKVKEKPLCSELSLDDMDIPVEVLESQQNVVDTFESCEHRERSPDTQQQPLPLPDPEIHEEAHRHGELPSPTVEEEDNQQSADVPDVRPSLVIQEAPSELREEEDQMIVVNSPPPCDLSQPTTLPEIEVAAADTASGEDSDEEMECSFPLIQFHFQALSPMPPSPHNSKNTHSDLCTPLSPIPPSPYSNHRLTISPLPVSPLKSLSPLPQSPDHHSLQPESPVRAHHSPPRQLQQQQAPSTSVKTQHAPLQFAAVAPVGLQSPRPCCVEVNVAASGTCNNSPTPTHTPPVPPARRQLRLSDSSPFSPPYQSTCISTCSFTDCSKSNPDRDSNLSLTSNSSITTHFTATPLIGSCSSKTISAGVPAETFCGEVPPNKSDVIKEPPLSVVPAAEQIEDGEITDCEEEEDQPLQIPPVTESTAVAVGEVMKEDTGGKDDMECKSKVVHLEETRTVSFLSCDSPPTASPFEYGEVFECNKQAPETSKSAAVNVEEAAKVDLLKKDEMECENEVPHLDEGGASKRSLSTCISPPTASPFEDGEISECNEQPLEPSPTLRHTDCTREDVKQKRLRKDVASSDSMEIHQCSSEYSVSTNSNTGPTSRRKIPKYSSKQRRKKFTWNSMCSSSSLDTSSFDELLSAFSTPAIKKNQCSPQVNKPVSDQTVHAFDARAVSQPKRKPMRKDLSITNHSVNSLAHLRNAAMDGTSKGNPTAHLSSEVLSVKEDANYQSTCNTAAVADATLDATPVHSLPGYQLRSREVEFWERVPKPNRKRTLSDGNISEIPMPDKVRKMSDYSVSGITKKSVEEEKVLINSSERSDSMSFSKPTTQDDGNDLLDVQDILSELSDNGLEIVPDPTEKNSKKEEAILPVAESVSPTKSQPKSRTSNSTHSVTEKVVKKPKVLVRQTDGATGQEEDQTPANSPKGIDEGPVKHNSVVVEQNKELHVPSVAGIGYGQPQLSIPAVSNKPQRDHQQQPLKGRSITPDDDIFNTPPPLVGNTLPSPQQRSQNPAHMGGARPGGSHHHLLSPAQQQLHHCMQCHLPLPVWLVTAMTQVQSKHEHCSASGKGVSKKKRSNAKTPIMIQPKQKKMDYILLNLERMVCGHLHLSAMITMFTNERNIPSQAELVQATIRFLLESYNPKTEHVVSLYHSLCDAVRVNPAQLNPYDGSFPPALLRPECQLVALFAHICRMCPNMGSVVVELNKALYQAILQPNLKFHKLAALLRVFTAVCRLQNDKDRLIFLCYDLIQKPLLHSELPVIGGVASVWPLPLARKQDAPLMNASQCVSQKALEQQILSYTLEMVVMRMFKSQQAKLHDSFPKNLYTLCRWNASGHINQLNDLTAGLVEILKTSKAVGIDAVPPSHTPWRRPCPSILAYHIVQALRLLSFSQGWVWTNDTLIRAQLWPILQRWNKDRTSVREPVIVCAVRLIGFISKQGLTHETSSSSISQLQRVLKALLSKNGDSGGKKISLPVQLAAVDSLFELCPPSHPHAREMMEIIQTWLQVQSAHPCGTVLKKEFELRFRDFAKSLVIS